MHVPERARERFRGCRNQHQVYVIRHEAVGEDRHPMLNRVLAQQGQVGLMIGVGEENLRAVIPALGDVMRQAGADKAGNPRH
jgi:hypothetical protein